MSCPNCDSANPVNAFACWRCEHALQERLPVVAAAPAADPSESAADGPPTAPPSFFPVLREEVDGVAAHNDSIWEAAPPAEEPPFGVTAPAPRAVPSVRLIVAALCGAAVASLVFLLGGRGSDTTAPPATTLDTPAPAALAAEPVRDAVAPARAIAPPAVAPPPTPAAPIAVAAPAAVVAVPPPARVARAPRGEPRTEPAPARPAIDPAPTRRAAAPAPAPVKGPCTPNIAALGLCSLDSP